MPGLADGKIKQRLSGPSGRLQVRHLFRRGPDGLLIVPDDRLRDGEERGLVAKVLFSGAQVFPLEPGALLAFRPFKAEPDDESDIAQEGNCRDDEKYFEEFNGVSRDEIGAARPLLTGAADLSIRTIAPFRSPGANER